jgi:hypothetical protein
MQKLPARQFHGDTSVLNAAADACDARTTGVVVIFPID